MFILDQKLQAEDKAPKVSCRKRKSKAREKLEQQSHNKFR